MSSPGNRCVQVDPGATGNSSCYDTATMLKVLVPLAAVAPANPMIPLVISPLSTVLAAAAANGTELASAVRLACFVPHHDGLPGSRSCS